MDPLSSAASIITVLHVSNDVVKYIICATGYSKERKHLREEILALESILLRLQDNIEDLGEEPAWRQKVRTLEGSLDSPLSRLFGVLSAVKMKLEPKRGQERVKAALMWPFDERELQKLHEAIEREKSLLQIALTADHG